MAITHWLFKDKARDDLISSKATFNVKHTFKSNVNPEFLVDIKLKPTQLLLSVTNLGSQPEYIIYVVLSIT